MLPPNAVFKVAVLDISRADAAAVEIGKVDFSNLSAPPINFSIAVDASHIDPRNVYTVRAEIFVGEKLIFTTDRGYPVLTRGAENRVEILLKRVNSKKNGQLEGQSDASLINTYWKIKTLHGEKVAPGKGQREPHLILQVVDDKEHFVATVGCNRLAGSFTLAEDNVTFSPPLATRMACPPALESLETLLGQVLVEVKKWRITADSLELLDGNGSPVGTFEAVYLK